MAPSKGKSSELTTAFGSQAQLATCAVAVMQHDRFCGQILEATQAEGQLNEAGRHCPFGSRAG